MRFLFLFDKKVKGRVLSPRYLYTLIIAFSLDVTWEYYVSFTLVSSRKKSVWNFKFWKNLSLELY